MERRFLLFIVLSFAIVFGYARLMQFMDPPKQGGDQPGKNGQPVAEQQERPEDGDPENLPPVQPDDQARPDGERPDEPIEPPEEPPAEPPAEPPKPIVAQAEIARRWVTLGSADPDDPYRMLVTLTNEGAAVGRIELSGSRYRDLEYRGGYLGHLVMDEKAADKAAGGPGCLVQVVGGGTPAAKAGLKPGDLIEKINGKTVAKAKSLARILESHDPGEEIELLVKRHGEPLTLRAKLARKPLEVTRPESSDPLSFLFTFHQIDDAVLPDEAEQEDEEEDERKLLIRPEYVNRELPGVDLRTANWELLEGQDKDEVRFRRRLPKFGLEVIKTYKLKRMSKSETKDRDCKAYHLTYKVEIRNIGEQARRVAYQQDGPTGLPTEGWWYARKIGREWGAVGLRDMVISKDPGTFDMIGCPAITAGDFGGAGEDQVVTFIGIDAQYFSAVMIPKKKKSEFAAWQPMRVGKVDGDLKSLTNTSCRLTSHVEELKPGAEPLSVEFEIFAGPKRSPLLAKYGLDELVYYGWFSWLAVPMVFMLHFFHDYVVFSYGLAILMLTVLVRGCMFPLSRKQALGARKMQELQPEIKKLQEKHKKDMEARTKAQQELFRKHNYNPLSGCLVLFVQLPIFVALYRSLIVDIELRQAPLLWEGLWCSNLAAPDMLYNWSGFMPEFITRGVGFFGLGPYFNLLPILTIALFIMQQKMFMPPPADEQAAMQQKIMKFMMVFMGVLFFKIASGLCVYFIASSLWGLAERKFLPKSAPAAAAATAQTRADAKARVKDRAEAAPLQAVSGRDGAAARGKKSKKGQKGK